MGQANSYDCYSGFVIRTPVFPLDKMKEIPDYPDKLLEFVRQQWQNHLIKDAIQLASPALFTQLNSEISQGNLSLGISNSFLRYYIRMCYRSTPFGLFAGVGIGLIGPQTEIKIKEFQEHQINCRLDMEFLGARVMKWTADLDFRPGLSYQSNTSLYKIGAKWRYIEVFYLGDARKRYRIVAVDRNPILDEIIMNTDSIRSWIYLIEQVVGKGYKESDATAFLNELVDSQILVPEWYPNLTGQEFSTKLLGKVFHLSGEHLSFQNYRLLVDKISSHSKPGRLKNQVDEIIDLAKQSDVKFNPAHLIQGDLQTSFENAELSQDLSNRVLMGIRILKALSRQRPRKILEEFKKQFEDRFGSQKIALPLVMDAEYGIGLSGPIGQQMADPSPLLDQLDFPVGIEPDGSRPPHPVLLAKINESRNAGSLYIDLNKSDIRELGIQKGHWPNQVYAMCRLAGDPLKTTIVFDLASAGNPAHLLGRFGFMEPEGKLNELVEEMIKDDIAKYPDHLLAEIVHLPEDRTGNILQRPSYYDWEIPYLASSGDEAGVIHPNEIMVSVVDDKIVLRHKNQDKTILPRLTNAHNYQFRQLPLYQFLAECVHQDSMGGFFPGWGYLSEMYDFLPGIRYGQLVLTLPRWRVKVEEDLKKTNLNGLSLYERICEWAGKNKLPERVIWTDGDQEMFIHWANSNIVLSAWESIRTRKHVLFRDFLYEHGSPVRSPGGEHANQVLLSFHKSSG